VQPTLSVIVIANVLPAFSFGTPSSKPVAELREVPGGSDSPLKMKGGVPPLALNAMDQYSPTYKVRGKGKQKKIK
jgi:hypothetical protein